MVIYTIHDIYVCIFSVYIQIHFHIYADGGAAAAKL